MDLWAQCPKDAAGRLFSWGKNADDPNLTEKIEKARTRGAKGNKHREYWSKLSSSEKKKVKQAQKKKREGDWWSITNPRKPLGGKKDDGNDGPDGDDGFDTRGGGLADLANSGGVPAYVHIG